MGVILDAWKAWWDPATNAWLFGEAKQKHTRYMEMRARLKRQPLTNAERKVLETADRRSELYTVPFFLATYAPLQIWLRNRFTRKVQNRLLRMIARQPFYVLVMYSVPAIHAQIYVRAQITDKFFTRDSGIVELAEKYQRDGSIEGAKLDESPDGFIYGIDGTSKGGTSGETDY